MSRACEQCGDCCTHMVLPVALDSQDYYRWLEYHGGQIVAKRGMFCVRLEVPCRHLVQGRCAIYDERPQMCREWKCEREEHDAQG